VVPCSGDGAEAERGGNAGWASVADHPAFGALHRGSIPDAEADTHPESPHHQSLAGKLAALRPIGLHMTGA